jgi:hypothetical protein
VADEWPEADVIITLEDGGEHAICHGPKEHAAKGRSWSTWEGANACNAAVARVLRAIPGSAPSSPKQALAEATRAAAARGYPTDARGRCLVPIRPRDRVLVPPVRQGSPATARRW